MCDGVLCDLTIYTDYSVYVTVFGVFAVVSAAQRMSFQIENVYQFSGI